MIYLNLGIQEKETNTQSLLSTMWGDAQVSVVIDQSVWGPVL